VAERGQIMLMKGHDLPAGRLTAGSIVSVAQRLTGQVANGGLARSNLPGDYTPRCCGKIETAIDTPSAMRPDAPRDGVCAAQTQAIGTRVFRDEPARPA
jgi:hypothetical protein